MLFRYTAVAALAAVVAAADSSYPASSSSSSTDTTATGYPTSVMTGPSTTASGTASGTDSSSSASSSSTGSSSSSSSSAGYSSSTDVSSTGSSSTGSASGSSSTLDPSSTGASSSSTGTRSSSGTGTGTASGPSSTSTMLGKNTFSVHPDGTCRKKLSDGATQEYEVKQDMGFPKFTTLTKPEFPGAEAKDGGGWNVYWNIPKPGDGCRYQVMLPYRQESGQPGYPSGNEIINVGREGCYFGNIPTDSDVFLSYCCGSGDCEKMSLNSTSLLSSPQRRELALRDAVASKTAAEEKQKRTLVTDMLRAGAEALAPRKGGSPAVQAAAHSKRYWYEGPPPPPKPSDCKVVKPGQPYSRAGRQVVVSPSQNCAQTPCSITFTYTITYSTTATSQKTTTLTNSVGYSVALQAGVDFIEEATITETLSTEFSKAVAEATGLDLMHGNSSTVTQNIAIALGNRGMITFTPVYRCVTGPLDCGNGPTDSPIDFCQPDLSGLGGSPTGDFYPLVSD